MSALDIALALAANGLPVFPCARDKRPTIPTDKGGHGLHDATTDPGEIRRLFGYPGAILVGCRTGEASGFDVLDLDYRHRAHEWEAANAHRLPDTRIHATMSGGRHYLFRHVHGVRNSAGRIAPGIDVRGDGGYVVMPPSDGYEVLNEAEISEWPDWLLVPGMATPELQPPKANGHAPREPISSRRMEALVQVSLRAVASAGEGQKHFTLRNHARRLGGLLHYHNFSRDDAISWLMQALPATAKDLKAARRTAEWGLDAGASDPIELTDSPEWQAKQRSNGHEPPPTSPDDPGYEAVSAFQPDETLLKPETPAAPRGTATC